jgi:antitoxin ParD1/3/4
LPTRNVNLTPQLSKFVDKRIARGDYANASEVLRAGLRALAQDEREEKEKLKALRAALKAGEESGVYEGDVFSEMRAIILQRDSS